MYRASETHDGAPADLQERLVTYAGLVQQEIRGAVQGSGVLEPFYGMMAYHLGFVDRHFHPIPSRAGKSLRPALCMLLAEALGGSPRETAALAAGIELLHNFSLVHDDIEDRSETRRGRATVWSLWGAAQAINVGDGMFSLAHQLWLSAPVAARDPRACLEMVASLERAVSTLCEGQYLDMRGEGDLELSSAHYLAMIGKKTAALIGEAAFIGARSATDAEAVLAHARNFGSALGLAFQIRDDLLGIWGDEAETGKSVSSDIATRKMTLPVILALEQGDDAVRSALRLRYGSPPADQAEYREIRRLLTAAGAEERTRAAAEQHWGMAMAALDRLPLGDVWRERLRRFARSFVERTA